MNKDNNKLIFDVQPSMRTIDDNGYLHVALTPISKATVNPYLGREVPGWEELKLEPDRISYALRAPEELKKAVATFNGLPLLTEHHEINADVQPKEYVVGSTGTDAVFEAPYLKNSLTVTDADAIKAIEDGSMKEISCAYRFTPDMTAGEYEADGNNKIHYDFIMRDISGNHVALVEEGRAGHDVAVADSNKEIKKEEEKMAKNKIIDFKKRRYALANDANLGIESSEVLSAGFQKALNAIEAQYEGYDPRKVGLDIDKNATIDDIIEKFMPGMSDEQKTLYKNVLAKLKGENVAPDAAPVAELTAPTTPTPSTTAPAKDDDFDDVDERMKDPAFKAGFEAGTRYGEAREKADPQRIDSDHEREGELEALGEDSIKKLTAKIKEEVTAEIKAKTVEDTKKHCIALNVAADKVRPLVGAIKNPLTFDSANEIYAFALRQYDKDPAKYPAEAYGGMIDILLDNVTHAKSIAQDSALSKNNFDDETEKIFDRLNNIG